MDTMTCPNCESTMNVGENCPECPHCDNDDFCECQTCVDKLPKLDTIKSEHYQRVERFMQLAKQHVPKEPTTPTAEVRLLRARLIWEECVNELIRDGLGVNFDITYKPESRTFEPRFYIAKPFDMLETIDGCCDANVVVNGTLVALGIPDLPFQKEVDENNLAKFGPGHSWREDGKLIKPQSHKPPRIKQILRLLERGLDTVGDIFAALNGPQDTEN